MANRISGASSSKLDAAAVAHSWLDRGIQPIPIIPSSKQPKGGDNWNKLIVTPETVVSHFKPGDNVGALWGEPSQWVVDVDLDWDEAALAAPRLLPETFVYGRYSRPGTHYLYRSIGATTRKWMGPKKDVIIEIRSTGTQSVLPPSMHPDNERYEINHDVSIIDLSAAKLRVLLDQVAAIALLARAYPESGSRHDFIHSLAGGLLRDGCTGKEVRNLLAALLDAVGRKENDRPQRERTVENTIEHWGSDDRILGWKSLSGWIDDESMDRIREWIKPKLVEDVPTNVIPIRPSAGDPLIPPLPTFGGIVSEIAEWSAHQAYVRQPLFDLAVGLMCTALASQNKYVIDGWQTPLQPYFMLVAPTAGGKESALDSVFTFARRFDLQRFCFQGFQSWHALLDHMAQPPNMACWLWDEAARKLKSASRSESGQDFQVLSHLIQLFGRANRSAPGVPGRRNAIPQLDHPFLTILGAAQPQHLVETVTATDLSTGLLNRFLLFDSGDQHGTRNRERLMMFPSRLEDRVNRIRSVPIATGEYPFHFIRYDAKVYQMFTSFEDEAARLSTDGGGARELWGRANQHALIIAGITAVGIDPERPMITAPVAQWSIEFARWSCNRWVSRIEPSLANSGTERSSKTVEGYIRNVVEHSRSSRFAKRPKLQALMARGLMPKSILTMMSRWLRGRDLEDVLKTLVESEIVGMGEVDGNTVYWSKEHTK